MRHRLLAVRPGRLALVALVAATPVVAAPDEDPTAPSIEPSITEHVGEFGGVELRYRATAEEMVLVDDEGEPEAAIFSISYVAVEDDPTRPVTFLWNGGPGSSSVWLHMGAFGPVRVDVPSDARDDGGPPYSVVPNPGAFLDVSDVVFVDPVGTGFSHVRGEAEKSDFYGVRQDARAMARFIRRWIAENDRWNSPKFMGGESYGTTRAAAVIRELEGAYDDVAINGILLISTILDFAIVDGEPGNELPHLIHLPTMAATAHFHGVAGEGASLEEHVQRARDFATGDYALALLKGNSLTDEERARIRAELVALTGLDEAYVDAADLRLSPARFQKELLRGRGLTVGRLDSRYSGVDLDAAGERPDADPSFYGIDGAYSAVINDYLRRELGVETERSYSVIGGLGGSWDWKLSGGRDFYLNLAPAIGTAMRQNSDLHVFVAAGYFDFATPFFGAEYSLNRAGVVSERVRFAYYQAGHMMYVHHPSLAKLQDDVRRFLVDALADG